MGKTFTKCMIVFFLLGTFLGAAAENETDSFMVRQRLLLLPVVNLTRESEYRNLADFILNVLKVNLEKAGTLELVPVERQMRDSADWLAETRKNGNADCILVSEYFVNEDRLHLMISLYEVETGRIKYGYTDILPADLDVLPNLERIGAAVAVNIVRIMPELARETLLKRKVRRRLIKKIDEEEQRLEEIQAKRSGFQAAIFSCVGIGRSVISYSPAGPLIGLSLILEYTYYFDSPFHIRFGVQYIPFDLFSFDSSRMEGSAEILFGLHNDTLFHPSLDVGLALIYDYNSASSALSGIIQPGDVLVFAPAERLSLSLPIEAGVSLFLDATSFLNIRFRYQGLTLTFEPLSPDAYEGGNRLLRYSYGFSPWSLLSFAASLQWGVRF
ncbi:MAG: hypothetical protein JW969_08135 [Spirochaetales bacterium]|nr:hypothetical protein [Spirochaetales bacterium]